MKKLFAFMALMMVLNVSDVRAQQQAVGEAVKSAVPAVAVVQTQQDNLKYVPAESDFLITINFKQILSDPEVKAIIEESISKSEKNKKDYDEFKAATGIDIYKDIDSATIFSSGKTDPKNPEKQMAAAVLNGNFDKAKIIANAEKDERVTKDVTIGKIEGFDAFIPKDSKDGAGLFLDNKSIAIGSLEGINKVAKVAKGEEKNVSTKAEMLNIINKMNKSATLAGAGLVPEELKATMKGDENAEPFSAIKQFLFDFTKGESISFNFTGEVDKKEDLEKLLTTLNGYLVMLKSFAESLPEAAAIVKQITISSENTSVKISFNVQKSQIEALRKKLEGGMGGEAEPAKEGKAGRE